MAAVITPKEGVRLYRRMPNYKRLLVSFERRAVARHGILSRDEARQAGLTDHVIDDCVASGRWVRVHPRVFRLAAHPETFDGRALAALKWAGEDRAFLSHGSALALEGVGGFQQARDIHITAPTGRSTPGVIVHRLRRPARTRVRRGIRTCRIERALLDACGRATATQCGEAMDDALRRQLTTLDRLWAELNAAGRGVRGGRAFRVVLEGRDHRDGKLESKLEAKLLVILRRIKDHRFEVQVPIAVNGKNYRIDFYESTRRLGVEGQGVRWHLGTERTKRDWERHNKLSLAGLTMLYYTWDDVHFRPKEVEAEIRAMLRPVPSVMPALN